MNRFFESTGFRRLVLFLLYIMVAGACFNGFYTKWRFHDGHPMFSLSYIAKGTAYRPYVYRQLLPTIANGIQAILPARTVDYLSERLADPTLIHSRYGLAMRFADSEALQKDIALRYYLTYYLTFVALVASLFVMRQLCLHIGASNAAATTAPLVLALLLPFLFTQGGYYYDFLEILFLMLAVLVASRSDIRLSTRSIYFAIIAALGTWNKEALFWFTPTLYPLLRQHCSRKTAIAILGGMLLICGSVYSALWLRYANNPGGTTLFQFWHNLRFYPNPVNWFLAENTYGVLLPRGFSIVMALIVAGTVWRNWKQVPTAFQHHAITALSINLPLFLLFCWPGEMRNLSMLYPIFLILIAISLTTWLARHAQPQEKPYTPIRER